MKIKNPPLFWLIVLFIIANIGDVISTIFILDGEMNPLFIYLGNWGLLIGLLLKILVISVFINIYKKNEHPNKLSYFLVILILVYGVALLTLAVVSNIDAASHPEELAAMKHIAPEVKASAYGKFVTILYFIPVGMALLAFWIYEKTEKHIKIVKKKKKPKKKKAKR